MSKTFNFILIRQFFCLILLYCLSSYSWANNDTHSLQIADKSITVELAQTEDQRRIGLMHRTKLAPNHGMLFIFNENNWHCFWMKNTLVPLSIAFIDEQNTIVDIQDMQAQSLDTHCPVQKVNQALEMNQGWFTKNKIKVGDKIQLN